MLLFYNIIQKILNDYLCCVATVGGAPWRSWLKHCIRVQKVGASFPDGVIGYGHDLACNRNEYQENFLEVKVARA
jgi:hypothetical protein